MKVQERQAVMRERRQDEAGWLVGGCVASLCCEQVSEQESE